MSKRYIHTVDDPAITSAALFKALADENPASYPVGGIYILANGTYLAITANSGTAVTVGEVTVA